MVNKENMRLWVAGLRSRAFVQGRSHLKYIPNGEKEPKYCCLGVACEVAMRNGVQLKETKGVKELLGVTFRFDAREGFLPPSVIDWLGIEENGENPLIAIIPSNGRPVFATDANDSFSWTFEVIADAIEAHYKLNED